MIDETGKGLPVNFYRQALFGISYRIKMLLCVKIHKKPQHNSQEKGLKWLTFVESVIVTDLSICYNMIKGKTL